MKQLRRFTRTHSAARIAVGIGLFALLVTSVVIGGAVVTHASYHPVVTQRRAQPPQRNVRAEGQWYQLSHFDNKVPAPGARMAAMRQAARLPLSPLGATPLAPGKTSNRATGNFSPHWISLGPDSIDITGANTAGDVLDSGRVTALAVNPNNSNDVWLGAADGGVWHSTDGGKNWTGPWFGYPTLSVGAVTIDTHSGNPYTVYVGTGEANENGDAAWGAGIMKSTDGGQTWSQLGSSQFGEPGVSRIAVDPTNSAHLLAGLVSDGFNPPPRSSTTYVYGTGIWQSTDGGSTWSQVLGGNAENVNGTDVVFDPVHPGVAFAGLGNEFGSATPYAGVYKSTDGGTTWTALTSSILPSSAFTADDVGRVSLGLSGNGEHVYAVIAESGYNSQTNGSPDGSLLDHAIYVSADNGETWAAKDVSGVSGLADDDGLNQWWYDNYAVTDPTDSLGNTLYVGGVDLWKTTNGGTTWTNLTNISCQTNCPPQVHADQHALAFFGPSSSSFYIGNDGGVWSSTNGGSSFTDLNAGGLNITQFYGGSVESNPNQNYPEVYGGTQGTGLDHKLYPSWESRWDELQPGDAGDVAIDYNDTRNVYSEFPYGALYYTAPTSNGLCLDYKGDCMGFPGNTNFIMPFVISPNNSRELIAGSDRVWRNTTAPNDSWSQISPILDPITCSGGGACGEPISAIAVARGNDSVIYVGDNAGNIFVTVNGGSSWTQTTTPAGSGMVTSISIDPTNPQVVFASFNAFASGAGQHLFRSTDGGSSWTDVSTSLPNVPFESVLVSLLDHNLIIVGTDIGVLASEDGGTTWSRFYGGVANVTVDQVFSSHDGHQILVATQGNGMWQLEVPHIQVSPAVSAGEPGKYASSTTFTVQNSGVGPLNWSVGALPSFVSSVSPIGGSVNPGTTESVTVNFNPLFSYTAPQTLTGTIPISDGSADNSPVSVDVSVVLASASKTWYFAEGYTGGSFTEYLTLANPGGGSDAWATVEYLLGGGRAPIIKGYRVPNQTRQTLNINQEIGSGQNVSIVVSSDQPIVAERPMYFTYTGLSGYSIPGGSDVLGATSLGTGYDFGYLDTTAGHATYLTILNQNSSDMTVTTTYYAALTGKATLTTHVVPKNSRGTINVNAEGLPAGTYSATVALSEPGLVERPLYLKDSTTGYTGSADVVGVSQPLTNWYFAEGYTGSTFNERYILSNPGSNTAHATVTFYKSDGSSATQTVTLNPGIQQAVNANAVLGVNVNNSASVSSDQPILAERFMSFRYVGAVGAPGTSNPGIPGASDVLGASAPSQLFDFAEGYSGGQFGEYLTIENPNSQPVTVQVTLLATTFGSTPTVQYYMIGATSRFTLYTNSIMVNQSFSMQVVASAPVVAERPIYFAYNGSQTGGSDIIGYQP